MEYELWVFFFFRINPSVQAIFLIKGYDACANPFSFVYLWVGGLQANFTLLSDNTFNGSMQERLHLNVLGFFGDFQPQ